LQDSGVIFKLNFNVGKDKSFKELKEAHDAIVIATGVYKSRDINLNKENFSNVIPALKYLTTSNKVGLNDKVEDFDNGLLNASNKNVIVVGGGDTAMDCVRTAIRQGAKDVKCLYRRDKNNMPGSQREVENAIEEGVDFNWLTLPIQYQGNNNLDQVKIAKMELGSPDETGRRKPEIKKDSEEILNADLVIEALGFEPEELPIMFDEPALNVTQWGTLKVNYKNLMTSLDGVFAAGDIVRGASLVVWGIKDGRDAANHIHNYLENNQENKRAVNE
jgi:glutamate synthase (NADPH/NADH) small chain